MDEGWRDPEPVNFELTAATNVTRLISVNELPDRLDTKASLRAL